MKTSKRGFASMSSDQRQKIARMGGVAAHQKGTAHEFTVHEARLAGKKGGLISGRVRRRRSGRQINSSGAQP